jgi:hypothetical protein
MSRKTDVKPEPAKSKPPAQKELTPAQLDQASGGVTMSDIHVVKTTDKSSPILTP